VVGAVENREKTREETILSGLNEAQRGAVLHGDGPLLIVAGAGTGKTTVLTRRIAHLITSRRARPEEILALTFTEKAAREMAERVDQLVPYGYTESFIATFHAFGDRILRENGFAAALPADFRVLSRADEVVFLRERLFSLPLDRFRPLGDPGRHLQTLVEFTSRAKDEDVSPDDIRVFAEERLRRASAGGGEEADAEREQARDLLEAAEFFRAQQAALAAAALVDFGDQIHLTLKLLRQRPDVALSLRKRFRYILVDEFQDTNHAQLELIRLIAGEGSPNITVVGDDDQAIYRWRGAAPANLIHFLDVYPNAIKVVLRQNYRSTQEILDTAYRLITYNNPHRLEAMTGLDKRLVADRGRGKGVSHRRFPTVSAESDAVAQAIDEFHRDGVPLDEIAILVRNNADADPFLRSLNMRGLAHRFSGGAGLFERPEVRSLIAFLRLVAAPDDSVSAWALAFSEIYAFDPVDLSRLSRYASKKTRPLLDVLRELEGNEDLASVKGPSREAAKKFVADIERGVASMAHKRTGEALYEFLKETGYLARLAAVSSAKDERRVANIARFFEIVRGFSVVAENDNIPAFVARFDLLREAGEDPSASETQEGDAVNLMTVHKAKGLEFRVVFVASCVEQKFPLRRRSDPLPLPPALLKSDISPGDAHLMEERRLFYVSMTRAKNDLILTSADDYGSGTTRKVSRFVVEALDLPSPRARVTKSSPLETIAASAPVPESPSRAPGTRSSEPGSLATAMAPPLRLSFRQVDDYLTCPLKYRFVHRNRIPLLTHHRVVYGSAIHQAVQEMFKARQAGVPFGVDELFAEFRRAWVSEGFLSREHEDLRLKEGERTLRRFFEWESRNPLRPTGVEEEFSFPVGRTRVIGRYDLVVAKDEGVAILDFKTGDVSTEAKAQQRAEESLQLAIYTLAHLRITGRLPSRVELRFLESDLVGGFAPTEALALATEKQIAEVADSISRGRFEATPSHGACRPCPFRDVCPATAKDD
jgi:DNA helicase II / ATP-dependent DNA helicase PcrA